MPFILDTVPPGFCCRDGLWGWWGIPPHFWNLWLGDFLVPLVLYLEVSQSESLSQEAELPITTWGTFGFFFFLFQLPAILYSCLHPVLGGQEAETTSSDNKAKLQQREFLVGSCRGKNVSKLQIWSCDWWFCFLRMMLCSIYIDFTIYYKGRMGLNNHSEEDQSYKLVKRNSLKNLYNRH